MFSANEIPRIKDKTGAVLRRLLIVPFEARFSADKKGYDERIGNQLQSQETMEYLIVIGLKALKGVLDNHKFTESDKTKIELAEYEETNNPVIAFLNDCDDDNYDIENEPVADVFDRYVCFCRINGYTALSRKPFTKQIKKHIGLESVSGRINGKVIRVFKAVNDNG